MAKEEKNYLSYIMAAKEDSSEEPIKYYFEASKLADSNNIIDQQVSFKSESGKEFLVLDQFFTRIGNGLMWQASFSGINGFDMLHDENSLFRIYDSSQEKTACDIEVNDLNIHSALHLSSFTTSTISTPNIEIFIDQDGMLIQGFSENFTDTLKISGFGHIILERDQNDTSKTWGTLQILSSGAGGYMHGYKNSDQVAGCIFGIVEGNKNYYSIADVIYSELNPTNRYVQFKVPLKYANEAANELPASDELICGKQLNTIITNLKNELRAAGINLAD